GAPGATPSQPQRRGRGQGRFDGGWSCTLLVSELIVPGGRSRSTRRDGNPAVLPGTIPPTRVTGPAHSCVRRRVSRRITSATIHLTQPVAISLAPAGRRPISA